MPTIQWKTITFAKPSKVKNCNNRKDKLNAILRNKENLVIKDSTSYHLSSINLPNSKFGVINRFLSEIKNPVK